MNGRIGFTLIGLCVALNACSTGLRVGPMFKVNGPTGDFADTQGSGITVGAQAELAVLGISVVGDAAWTRFGGDDFEGQSYDAVSGFEVAAGGRVPLGPLFLGAEYGWIGGDLDHSVLRPELGVRFGSLTFFTQFQALDRKWWSLGGAYSFF